MLSSVCRILRAVSVVAEPGFAAEAPGGVTVRRLASSRAKPAGVAAADPPAAGNPINPRATADGKPPKPLPSSCGDEVREAEREPAPIESKDLLSDVYRWRWRL